jgi:hypothetical protein
LTTVDFGRLRRGELIAGAGGTLLLVFLFVPPWYALNGELSQTASNLGAHTSWNGWWGLGGWRYLVLLTIIASLALVYFQAAERAPAIPVTAGVIMTVLGVLSVLALLYRLLAGPPSDGAFLHQQVGPYLGLLAALAIVYGGYASLRAESGSDPAAVEIETVRLDNGIGS